MNPPGILKVGGVSIERTDHNIKYVVIGFDKFGEVAFYIYIACKTTIDRSIGGEYIHKKIVQYFFGSDQEVFSRRGNIIGGGYISLKDERLSLWDWSLSYGRLEENLRKDFEEALNSRKEDFERIWKCFRK